MRTLSVIVALAASACALDTETSDPGGDGKADGVGSGPSCSSAMFDHVRDAISAEDGSLVPPALLRTTYNRPAPAPLLRGPAIFGAMADLIAGAKTEVTFETWNWVPDSEPTRQLIDGIARLNRRRVIEGETGAPVQVNLLLNFSPNYPREYMGRASAQIAAAGVDPTQVNVVLASYEHLLLGANHAKTLTVDGRVAIVAGTNASPDNGSAPNYYDAGFVLEGDAALAVRDAFAGIWLDSQSERWLCGEDWQAAYDPDRRCEVANTPLPTLPRPALGISRDKTCSPVLVATRDASGVPLPNHVDHADPLAQAFLTAVALAQHEIVIQTPNLNEPVMMNALLAAAKAGVRVDIVLSEHYEDSTESLPGRGGTNAASVDYIYDQLASFPDACERVRIRWFSEDGVTSITANGPPTSHLKFMAVDGELAFVGSSNQDVQSWHNSREIMVVVDEPAIVDSWRRVVTLERAVPTERCR